MVPIISLVNPRSPPKKKLQGEKKRGEKESKLFNLPPTCTKITATRRSKFNTIMI
jgi:hypothetical protein